MKVVSHRRIVGYLDGLAGPVAVLARPGRLEVNLQSEPAAALDVVLPKGYH